LFALFTGCGQLNQPSSAEKEIREIRTRSNQAIADKDTVALGSCWTKDIHVISSRNSELSGRRNNQEAFLKEFDAGKIFIRTPTQIQVFEDWNMAGEQGNWEGRWRDGENSVEVSGSYFAKWHRMEDKWLIRSETFVPLKCSGSPFCDKSPI
jgi:ketosteroid isomerase-like protein